MLIVILILLCLLLFLALLILGGAVLIKRKLYQRQVRRLPQVKPDILSTLAEELNRVVKSGRQSEEALRWMDEFFSEQPSLAHFFSLSSQEEGKPDVVPALIVYKLLKAQIEAETLSELMKE